MMFLSSIRCVRWISGGFGGSPRFACRGLGFRVSGQLVVVQWSGSSSVVRILEVVLASCASVCALEGSGANSALEFVPVVRSRFGGALGSVLPRQAFAGPWRYTPPPPGRYNILLCYYYHVYSSINWIIRLGTRVARDGKIFVIKLGPVFPLCPSLHAIPNMVSRAQALDPSSARRLSTF